MRLSIKLSILARNYCQFGDPCIRITLNTMIINLISGPRNVSTALMYSFAQRQDTKVVDEPFYAYYLKLTGFLHPGRKRILRSMSSDIKEITDQFLADDVTGKVLFIKNMAHHHIDIDDHFLHSVTNVFLIRRPDELLVSFAKVIKDPTLDDIGMKKSWELYHDLMEKGKETIVIDSGELMKDPPTMLQKMCDEIGIAFDNSMLSWEPGPSPEDGVWAEYWYHNLHKTAGFVKSEPKKVTVPEELQPVCDDAMNYYKELYEHSIKI